MSMGGVFNEVEIDRHDLYTITLINPEGGVLEFQITRAALYQLRDKIDELEDGESNELGDEDTLTPNEVLADKLDKLTRSASEIITRMKGI